MSLEDRLTQSLDEGLARLDAAPAGLADVERRARGVRRRRTVVAGVAVAAVVAAIAIIVPRLGDDRVDPIQPTGTWQELPPAPLSARYMALSGWTGEEVLVVGGTVSSPCPEGASGRCGIVSVRSGAAYDVGSRTWRKIAKAPIPMQYWFRTTMVGDTMVVLANFEGIGRWFAYDASDDAWRALPAPDRKVVDSGRIPSLDGRVYVVAKSGQVQVLDLATETWSELPPSPLTPALGGQSVVPTDQGIFVSGVDATAPVEDDTPQFTLVDRWDGEKWTRLPPTGQIGIFDHWTGTRLVSTDIQTAPGLRGDPPLGGVLDPSTGEWSPLPNAPNVDDLPSGWSVNAAAGPLVAGWGYVYDDRDGSWSALGNPDTPVDEDQTAVWADDRLVVVGGIDRETAYDDVSGLSNEAWTWTP